jgi:hypothetical protein
MLLAKPALVAASICAAMLAAVVLAAPATIADASGLPSTSVTPEPSAPGTATTFNVFCGRDGVSATLFGVTLGLADLILMHSTSSSRPGDFEVTVTLPANIKPGTYHPDVDCSNGVAGSATLHVDPIPGRAPDTGDGTTATQTGTSLVPIGFGMMALGLLTGAAAVAFRRRPAHRH